MVSSGFPSAIVAETKTLVSMIIFTRLSSPHQFLLQYPLRIKDYLRVSLGLLDTTGEIFQLDQF